VFVLRNLWRGRKLAPFGEVCIGDFFIEPCSKRHLRDIKALYASLTGGRRLDLKTRVLLRWNGERFCLAARRRSDNRLIGMGLYYFNTRDRSNETIHVAYTGLDPSVRGCGLGHALRLHALRHFALCGLESASSRISIGNQPSLKGNLKLGFLPIESYIDSATAEQRQYLICKLDRYR
jgi:GNAT superfamily N-acetyltransferase